MNGWQLVAVASTLLSVNDYMIIESGNWKAKLDSQPSLFWGQVNLRRVRYKNILSVIVD